MKNWQKKSIGTSAVGVAISLGLSAGCAIVLASSFKAATFGKAEQVRQVESQDSHSQSARLFAKFEPALPNPDEQRQLSFAERVAFQYAVEEVYWRHRIWPETNGRPKPAMDEVMPPAEIEQKVHDYLRNAQLLADYWHQPLTAEQLQAEVERMTRNTRQPEVLQELFSALGHDPFIIAECLAKPILAERLVTKLYAHDERFHGDLKRRAESDLRAHPGVRQMKRTSGSYSEIELIRSDDRSSDKIGDGIVAQTHRLPSEQSAGEASALQWQDAPNGIRLSSSEWQETVEKLAAQFDVATALSRRAGGKPGEPRQSEAATTSATNALAQIKTGVLTSLQEDDWRYYATAVLKKTKDRLKLATLEWRKEPFESWRAAAETQPKESL